MVDITPRISQGKQVIARYGNGGFVINNVSYNHSVVVLPDSTVLWPVKKITGVKDIPEIIKNSSDIDLLLIGTGHERVPIDADLLIKLKQNGISAEYMDTGAACRTFNVLLAEERRIAAALIAI